MSFPEIDIGLELFSLLGADRECPLPIKGRDSTVANSARPPNSRHGMIEFLKRRCTLAPEQESILLSIRL
jgi:hypothetical protein